MSTTSPLNRLRENIVGVVSTAVTGIWLAALFTGQEWWLPFMLVGYIMVVPLTALLLGDQEDIKEWWENDDDSTAKSQETTTETTSQDDALETLRERYARGELTDEQFERKVEQLLEIETIEDVEERVQERPADHPERERETELE